MIKQLRIVLYSLLLCFVLSGMALTQEYPILWEDHFDDDDPPAHKNVGWLYYGEEDGLIGMTVEQRDGALFVEAGSFGGIAGVGLLETNGLPEIFPDDEPATKKLLLENNYSDPNQILTFQVNFVRFTASFFMVATRMVQLDTSESIPDADPQETPGYSLFVSPLEKVVRVAKYEGELAALNPDSWTYFGEAQFAFELDVFYWMQFYLNEGDLKVKIWEGDLSDGDNTAWLIETADPEPRVTGKFTMFACMGPPPQPGQGDQFIIDDVVTRSSVPGASVDSKQNNALPTDFQLEQNFPNPFNPSTQISFKIAEKNNTQLLIYNTRGQVIRTLLNADLPAGTHSVTWDGLNDNSQPVTSGIYLYRLSSGQHTQSKRMIFLK